MIHYIAKKDVTVSSIYGTKTLVKGSLVDQFTADKFPQYVEAVEIPDVVLNFFNDKPQNDIESIKEVSEKQPKSKELKEQK